MTLLASNLKENETLIFSVIVLNQELNNDYSGTEIMLAQRLQAKPEPHEDPLLCGRLLQQEAAIFSQSPSTPPGCDVGYGEREFQRQLSASRLLLCFFDHAYRNSMELFIPIVHAIRHNPAVSRNILTKWQPPIWLGYRKAGVLMQLQLRLQSLHKHDFISNQLLFYC